MELPVLRDFPDQFESERLLIRAPRAGEGAAVHEAVAESLAELRPWMPWARHDQTRADVEEHIRLAQAAFLSREDLRLHLWSRADGAFVGSSGLHRIRWDVPRFEIGYWIRTSLAGRGFATEAARAVAAFAFRELGAERVEIRCDARNRASARVAERAGFRHEATLRRYTRANDGTLADELVFVRLREA